MCGKGGLRLRSRGKLQTGRYDAAGQAAIRVLFADSQSELADPTTRRLSNEDLVDNVVSLESDWESKVSPVTVNRRHEGYQWRNIP